MKAFGIAAAAVVALAPVWGVVAVAGVARAAPCAGAGSNPVACQHCMFYVTAYNTANVCSEDRPRPAQAPPSSVPTCHPPPMPALPEPAPVQPAQVIPPAPVPPPRDPMQIPTPAPGAPRD